MFDTSSGRECTVEGELGVPSVGVGTPNGRTTDRRNQFHVGVPCLARAAGPACPESWDDRCRASIVLIEAIEL